MKYVSENASLEQLLYHSISLPVQIMLTKDKNKSTPAFINIVFLNFV